MPSRRGIPWGRLLQIPAAAPTSAQRVLRTFVRNLVIQVIRRANSRAEAAEELGIDKHSLWYICGADPELAEVYDRLEDQRYGIMIEE